METNESKWLVKSSGQVLGPFTIDEIAQHLRARTLSILDEVREPRTRWSFVRENTIFKEVVKQVRAADDQVAETTQTTFVGTKTKTEATLEITEDIDELTPEPVFGKTSDDPSGDIRPILATERKIEGWSAGSSTFATAGDVQARARAQKTSHLGRYLVLGFAALILAVGGYNLYSAKRQRKMVEAKAAEQVRLAHEALRFGESARALQLFRSAKESIKLIPADNLLLAQLLIQIESKTVDGLRLLSEVEMDPDPQVRRKKSIVRSLAYIIERRWNEASAEIQTLLSVNPADEEALWNQAAMDLERGLFSTADSTVTELKKKTLQISQLVLLQGLVALLWDNPTDRQERMGLAISALTEDVEKNYEIYFEKSLVLAALLFEINQPDQAIQVVKRIWEADPFDSRNFAFSLDITQNFYSWEFLAPICERVTSKNPGHEDFEALSVVCLYSRGDTATALRKLDSARGRLSRSALLASVQALIFLKVDRISDSKSLLALSEGHVFADLVRGQICSADRDWICAEKSWSQVLKQVPRNPMAKMGIANAMKQLGNEQGARDLVLGALVEAPRYRPLLEARGGSRGL